MKILKWIGATLVVVVVLALLAVYGSTEMRFRRAYASPDHPIAVSGDAETIARGRHLATIRGCVDCHGPTLSGQIFIDAPPMARLYAPNLTSGQGGVGSTYTATDWERSIRHGIGRNGRPLLFMPSHEFHPLGDEDLAALVSYIASLPPVASEPGPRTVGPLGRLLVATGQIPNFVPAELIDHEAPHPPAPAPGRTVEYGAYLATGCIGCHGDNFSGGPIPGTPPDFPPASNITPHATGIGGWTEEDFFRLLREGRRPDGSEINPQMPWQGLGQMTDDEIGALWMFLRTVEPREYGNR
jgi:mono/diheme cytochrome c family protein